MVQSISAAYRDFDTSTLQNARLGSVVASGIYKGFYLSPGSTSGNVLNIVNGADSTSVLMTPQGVLVTEDSGVFSAVTVTTPHASLPRWDLAVCDYTYNTNPLVKAEYKVLKGIPAVAPVAPTQTGNQVALARIYVRPQNAIAGLSARIRAVDIHPVGKATLVKGSAQILDLYPEIAPTDTRLLYIHPGTFPDATGLSVVRFTGGYSSEIASSGIDGTIRYHLFGVTDQGQVIVIATGTTQDIEVGTTEAYPVAIVQSRVISGQTRLQTIIDVKAVYNRSNLALAEQDQYVQLLGTSIFKHVRIDTFNTLSQITTGTVSGGTATLDTASSSLVLTSSGGEVSFVTTDLLNGTEISPVDTISVQARTNFDNLQFSYSVTSATSGFSTQRYSLGEVVKISTQLASRLFLKFYVSAGTFLTLSPKIRSYGVLLNIDDEAQNAFNITEFGLDSVINSVTNLIHNGDFRHWSKVGSDSKPVELTSQSALTFAVTDTNPNAADGWQFTSRPVPFVSGVVQRINPSTSLNSSRTALLVSLDGSATTAGQFNVLEYRVPNTASLVGQHLTLALNYSATTAGSVSAGIAFLSRTPLGTVVATKKELVGNQLSGGIHVITDSTVGDNTEAISFFIKFTSTGGQSTTTIDRVRAAVGRFAALPFLYHENQGTALAAYYENGRLSSWGASTSSEIPITVSTQFNTPKHTSLGTLTVQTQAALRADRSINVADFAYEGGSRGFVLSAVSSGAGGITLDVDWEAFITYEGTIT